MKTNINKGDTISRDGKPLEFVGYFRGTPYGLEPIGDSIGALDPTWPLDEDPASVGANHFRNLKATLIGQFSNFNSPLSITSDKLNDLDSATTFSGSDSSKTITIGTTNTPNVNINAAFAITGETTSTGGITVDGDITAFASDAFVNDYPRLEEEGITTGEVSLWTFLDKLAKKIDDVEDRQVRLEAKYDAITELFGGLK